MGSVQYGSGEEFQIEDQNDDGGVVGPLLLGLAAVVTGLIGTFWMGMTGLVWRPWEFGATYHWDGSESSLGVAVGLFFYAIAVGALLWLVARGVWTWRRRSFGSRLLVVAVPIATIAFLFVAWTAWLSPGSSQPTWGL